MARSVDLSPRRRASGQLVHEERAAPGHCIQPVGLRCRRQAVSSYRKAMPASPNHWCAWIRRRRRRTERFEQRHRRRLRAPTCGAATTRPCSRSATTNGIPDWDFIAPEHPRGQGLRRPDQGVSRARRSTSAASPRTGATSCCRTYSDRAPSQVLPVRSPRPGKATLPAVVA